MLIRVFRGTTHPGMESHYARYLRDVAAKHILSHPGARELHIFDPLSDGGDFLVKTVWDDLPSLMSFAGKDWATPRIAAAEAEMVQEASVSHHRVGAGFHAPSIVVSSARVQVDAASGTAEIDGEVFRLPPLEARLLAELARRAGEFVDPAELARLVWRGSTAIAPNDVRRAIYRLRKLVGDNRRAAPVLRSRRGYGYAIEA